jgi:hypothetical protein
MERTEENMLVSCIKRHSFIFFVGLFALTTFQEIFSFATLQRNDPYPIYSTIDPQEYLYRYEREILKELTPMTAKPARLGLFLSFFEQSACKGRISSASCPDPFEVEIGDLDGRWGMIPLMFGPTPQGQTFPPALLTAKNTFFPGGPVIAEDPAAVDPLQQFGYFRVPIEYRKRGARIDLQAKLFCDIGLEIQTGFADLCQTATLLDQTALANVTGSFDTCGNPNFTTTNVECLLMKPVQVIADQIGLNICKNFHETSIEDIRAGLYWRHAYAINKERTDFPLFLCIPFFHVQASFPTGRERNHLDAFGLPFGNDGHTALGVKGGINLDFAETVEFGGEMGVTHFFRHCHNCFPMPTDIYQTGIFPFSTSVNIQPGDTWWGAIKLSAYHFVGNLSFWGQYMFINHLKDCISPTNPDPAFLPCVLECISDWRSQMANVAFNYDISPNFSIGVLWQAPVSQRRAYRSSTVLLSFDAVF